MNKDYTKVIRSIAAAAVIAVSSFSAVCVTPIQAIAAEGSVNDHIQTQARAVAAAMQTRVQVYWSLWVDKHRAYLESPTTQPEPSWPTVAEITSAIGGYNVSGITFAELNMPVGRDNSFNLQATIGDEMGGSAACGYVRNFLPMAVVNGNIVTIPVLRPALSIGIDDIANDNTKVNRDGSTNDGTKTFTDNADLTFGKDSKLTFDATDGGTITNVKEIKGNTTEFKTVKATNSLTAKQGEITENLTVGQKVIAGSAQVGDLKVTNNIDMTNAGKIQAPSGSTIYITGTSGSQLSKLMINSALTELSGALKINGALTGTTGKFTGLVEGQGGFKGNLDGTAKVATDLTGNIQTTQVTGLDSRIQTVAKTTKVNNAGNADSAGTATNLSGGTVSATTGTYSGTLTANGGINAANILPLTNNTYDMGTSANKWRNVYATNLYGSLIGGTVSGTTGTFTGTVKAPTFQGNLTGGTVAGTTGSYSGLLTANSGLKSTTGSFSGAVTAPSVTATTFTGSLSGNASTATKLATARLINGRSFDGTSDVVFGQNINATDAAAITEANISSILFTTNPSIQAYRWVSTPPAFLNDLGSYGNLIGWNGGDTFAGIATGYNNSKARIITGINRSGLLTNDLIITSANIGSQSVSNATTAKNVSGGGTVSAATGTFSGNLDVTGKLSVAGGISNGLKIYSQGSTHTRYNVVGAEFGYSYTGAYKITLPVKKNGAYISIEIEMMDYGNQVSRLIVSGYLYSGTTAWYTNTLQIIGGYTKGVTTGYDSNGYACIYLGDASTSWYWNKIVVTRVTVGNADVDGTWTISRVSSPTGTGLTALTPNASMTTQYARQATNVLGGTVSATTGVYSGLLTANNGISATTGTYSGALAANGGLTASTGTYSGTIAANSITNAILSKGQIVVDPTTAGSYREGIRINKASNNWASFNLGGAAGSTSGIVANSGQWFIASNPSNNLMISDESSNADTGMVFYSDGSAPTWKGRPMILSNGSWLGPGPASRADATMLYGIHSANGGDFGWSSTSEGSGQIDAYIDGAFYQNEGRYKVIDTANIGSYALLLSGGTLTGQITANFAAGSWLRGLDSPAPIYANYEASPTAYFPIIKMKTARSTFNLGGYGDSGLEQFGIYRFANSRTENAYDSKFIMNNNGDMESTGSITAPTFVGTLSGHATSDLALAGGTMTGTVNYNDVSRYWLATATNWGMYWNTSENQLQFNGAGANKANVDLDTGYITAPQFVGNASTATTATNVSGGTVSGTTGTFTGTVTAPKFDGTATSVGNDNIKIYGYSSNEINFGGASTLDTVYIGYRATDSRPVPANFVFGGSGSAKLTAGSASLSGQLAAGSAKVSGTIEANSTTNAILSKGQIIVDPNTSGNYNAGIRINRGPNGWTSLNLGGTPGSTEGIVANSGQWWIGAGTGTGKNFRISDENSDYGSGLELYANGDAPTWKGQRFLTSSNYGSYALPLSGGSLRGNLTLNNGPQLIVNTSTLPGGYARGMFFTDKTGTNAAVTAYGVNGTNEGISIAMGSASPWSSSAGLYITPSNITWKNSQMITAANIGGYVDDLTASSATKLATARSIALGTAATGIATAFDGTANITIPVTALNASYLSTGIIPDGRLGDTMVYNTTVKYAQYAQELSRTGQESNPLPLYVADAQTAANAPGYLPLAGGSLSGTLDANAGIKANRIGQLSFAGWNEIMRINTGSHGAIYNPYSGVFVGLDSSRAVYFGNNLEGQYYGSINANGWNGNVNGATPITAANVGSYTAGAAKALPITGTGNSNLTYYQSSGTYQGASGWASYIIANHGDGSNYYNQTIRLPFWGQPQIQRMENGVQRGWDTFITTANIGSYTSGGLQIKSVSQRWDCGGQNSYRTCRFSMPYSHIASNGIPIGAVSLCTASKVTSSWVHNYVVTGGDGYPTMGYIYCTFIW